MTVPSVSTRHVLGLVPEGGFVTFVHCAWAEPEKHHATTINIPIRENKRMLGIESSPHPEKEKSSFLGPGDRVQLLGSLLLGTWVADVRVTKLAKTYLDSAT
jgi:hypothetical protein